MVVLTLSYVLGDRKVGQLVRGHPAANCSNMKVNSKKLMLYKPYIISKQMKIIIGTTR